MMLVRVASRARRHLPLLAELLGQPWGAVLTGRGGRSGRKTGAGACAQEVDLKRWEGSEGGRSRPEPDGVGHLLVGNDRVPAGCGALSQSLGGRVQQVMG